MQAKSSYRYRAIPIRFMLFVWFLAICLAFPLSPVHPVLAAAIQAGPDFTVNDPADPGGAACLPASCSLRAAITAANAGGSPGGYTIAFDLTYPAIISLNSALPTITGHITLAGPGQQPLTISGGGQVRIFTVGSGAGLILTGVTLNQGWNGVEGGGAIRNGGSLRLNNVLLSDNLAGGGNGGGLLNDVGGSVVITSTTFLNNTGFHDGAIANSGNITITNSIFDGNRGRVGGAIENYTGSTMTITRSSFQDNVAKISSGGAIANAGNLVIANSTFYLNGSPTGADIVSGGTLHVTNSTFFGAISPSFNSIAGGGTGSTVVLRNNILAASTGIDNCATQPGGVFNVDASNLSTDSTCPGATLITPAQLNLSPLISDGVNPPILLPLPGSLTIGAGNDSICSAAVGSPDYGAGSQDQRGVHRPVGAHCDTGAVEVLAPVLYLPLILH